MTYAAKVIADSIAEGDAGRRREREAGRRGRRMIDLAAIRAQLPPDFDVIRHDDSLEFWTIRDDRKWATSVDVREEDDFALPLIAAAIWACHRFRRQEAA